MNKRRLSGTLAFVMLIMLSSGFCVYPSDIGEMIRDKDKLAGKPALGFPDGQVLQHAIDTAAPHSIIFCDRNSQMVVSTPVVIRKSLTLRGLNARLPDRLGKTSIIQIESEGVAITDFRLQGNAATVPQTERTALIQIYAGDFRLEHGLFEDSSKDGVEVGPREGSPPVIGGVIRDIVGRGCVRDVVSLGGPSGPGPHIRNILVENIRGYNSSMRGAVEVSDGCSNITVRTVYAENCMYAVDVQDHSKQEVNRDILIDDVYAFRCDRGMRTANHPHGHSNLRIMNLTAEECKRTLQVSNTKNVTIQRICIKGYQGEGAAMSVTNCDGLTIRDITLLNCTSHDTGLLVENCDDVTIDRVKLQNSESLSSGVTFRISADKIFRNLIITNVSAQNVRDAGIILERKNKAATLTDYLISNNIARVADRIVGDNRLFNSNLYD